MFSLRWLTRRLERASESAACRCQIDPAADVLQVDATECPGGGDLASEPACRRRLLEALRRRTACEIRVRDHGLERQYTASTVDILSRAARFAERIAHHDERLAALATRDPFAAAAEAAARAGPVADLATATGLASAVQRAPDLESAIRAYHAPQIAAARVARRPPPTARLRETYETDATVVRIYDADHRPVPTYHLEPLEANFEQGDYAILADAVTVLADGAAGPGANVHHAAVRTAVSDRETTVASVDDIARVLEKHTAGYGVLEDLFADPAVSDVYANAPADETTLRVVVDDEPMRTNVSLTADGAARIAGLVRGESGRPFSRAAPLVDAVATDVGVADRVRVAGVTTPVTDGTAFAFRAADADVWRLADLVRTGTLSPGSAAFLGLAVARGRSLLVAGSRGAGKTTLLAALLWELPETDRVILLEDTPELPVAALQDADRDALALRTATGDDATVASADALRAALRLGDSALVVGEVRGEEAAVLYEAMRVGANSSAVLGTIHGDGGASVEERVVSDLGVPRSSFAATDLVVTVERTPAGRRLSAIEEVTPDGFATLYERTDAGLVPTPRIRRGNSRFVARLARPEETYADVRTRLERRTATLDPGPDHPVEPPAAGAQQ